MFCHDLRAYLNQVLPLELAVCPAWMCMTVMHLLRLAPVLLCRLLNAQAETLC
jgi:hypothetical protein